MNEQLFFVRVWPVPLRRNICLLDANNQLPTKKKEWQPNWIQYKVNETLPWYI